MPSGSLLDDPLAALQERARSAPPRTGGEITLDGMQVHYIDLSSLYTAYKDIFKNRIYHFDSSSPRPRIIDGGSGIGMSMLYFKKIYPECDILCFEPDKGALSALRKNIAAQKLRNIRVIESGLSDRQGTASFERDGADGGRLSPDDALVESAANATVTISTDCLSRHVTGPVDFLKLNIEGQECAVLRELRVAGKLPLIREMVIEYHGWPTGEQSLGEILTLLSDAGFRYLIHDFDATTGPTSKPPFRLRSNAPWFCLIYAKQIGNRRQVPASNNTRTSPINWGDFNRTQPISRTFGLDRGTPIDRYYIENFLAAHASDIRGRVLEIADDSYTRRFGEGRVTHSDVLHAENTNRKATLIGDLSTGTGIPDSAFDCIILTQTLHCIYDIRSAVANAQRALKPGGILLASIPGISQISRYDMDRWGDYWRLTSRSARKLFEEFFPPEELDINSHGNVMASLAFLHGLAAAELDTRVLEQRDADYELLITIRAARKGES